MEISSDGDGEKNKAEDETILKPKLMDIDHKQDLLKKLEKPLDLDIYKHLLDKPLREIQNSDAVLRDLIKNRISRIDYDMDKVHSSRLVFSSGT